MLDRIVARASEAGRSICLATGTAAHPAWLARAFPEVTRTDFEGRRHRFGQRHNSCPSSPVFRRLSSELARRVARRYAASPSIVAWHVGNEYGGACYCDLCAANFRRWLREKYTTLDALNTAWYTTFWSHTLGDWNEIEPPSALTEHFASWDNYPPDGTSQARVALGHDLMRGLKDGQPFWLMEQTPSYTASRDVNPLKRPAVMRLWSWQAVAHGADAVLFFQMRASRGACEKYHGAVIGHAGRPDTRVFREVAELGAELERLGDAVLGARTPARVALLFDWDSWWALEVSDGPSRLVRYLDVVLTYYRALWDAGVDVDVVAVTADLSCYVVVAPVRYMLKGDLARRLEKVAARGGSVVATFLSGRADENNNAFLMDVPGPLGPLLGVRVDEWDARAPDVVNPVRLELGTAELEVASPAHLRAGDSAGCGGRRHLPGRLLRRHSRRDPERLRRRIRVVRRRGDGSGGRVVGYPPGAGGARPVRALPGRTRPRDGCPGRLRRDAAALPPQPPR